MIKKICKTLCYIRMPKDPYLKDDFKKNLLRKEVDAERVTEKNKTS